MLANNRDLVFKTLHCPALGEILKIEHEVQLAPWSDHTFRNCLAGNLYRVTGVFKRKCLVGYAVLAVNFPEAELQNIAIGKQFQNLGIGRLFLKYLVEQCAKVRLEQIFLEVRESNCAAINLYRKSGFIQTGIRENYYQSETITESALLFMLDISKSEYRLLI